LVCWASTSQARGSCEVAIASSAIGRASEGRDPRQVAHAHDDIEREFGVWGNVIERDLRYLFPAHWKTGPAIRKPLSRAPSGPTLDVRLLRRETVCPMRDVVCPRPFPAPGSSLIRGSFRRPRSAQNGSVYIRSFLHVSDMARPLNQGDPGAFHVVGMARRQHAVIAAPKDLNWLR